MKKLLLVAINETGTCPCVPDVFEAEKKVLEQHMCIENLILVNLDNHDELLRVTQVTGDCPCVPR